MLNFKNNKKERGFINSLSLKFKDYVDSEKDEALLINVSRGIDNRIIYQKFPDFTWPLWLSNIKNIHSQNRCTTPLPLIINSNFLEWQTFTNYLSNDEIHIDRCGMISGPGNSPWSIEFWYLRGDVIYKPQDHLSEISPVRDYKYGEIIITGNYGDAEFQERIVGGRSDIDEALVSYSINTNKADNILFILIRPYNCISIGGISSIRFDNSGYFLNINGNNSVAVEKMPDRILVGSGENGDVDCFSSDSAGAEFIECSSCMSTIALGYNLNKGDNIFNLRISLDKEISLSKYNINFEKAFKEFRSFSDIRMNEGLKIHLSDKNLTKYFMQSKLTLFNNNQSDFNFEKIDGFRNLFFLSYAMNRAGLEVESEKLVKVMSEKFNYNIKNPDYISVICASYLLNSFYECYIYNKDTGFLQDYFPTIRNLGNYIYKLSSEIHSIGGISGNSRIGSYINEAEESDLVVMLSALINISHLSRSMGIFGDESKYKNEADRIQSIIKNIIEKKRQKSVNDIFEYRALIAFPDNIISGYKYDEYREFFLSLIEEKDFPLFEPLAGIDLLSSAILLIHLISLKDERVKVFYEKFFSMIDDFFILPEFIDPITKRGANGDGNSKIIAALILVITRNRIFIDRTDRLELFPIPEKKWFEPGKKIKIDDASTRFGKISFVLESSEEDIKITFTSLPRFIPSDIMINLPFETSMTEADDFILKRKIGNSYIINGWPSAIKFSFPK
ncbi:MAG: hypothetical protein FWF73_06155 [Spirochaetes bacterium]|nr:hypothetical protein [Spirochaetota bacterium]